MINTLDACTHKLYFLPADFVIELKLQSLMLHSFIIDFIVEIRAVVLGMAGKAGIF